MDRRVSPVHVVLGVIFAGTALFLVPTIALAGLPVLAVAAAALWLGGSALVWVLMRRDATRTREAVAAEHATHDLFRRLVEHGAEAFLVVDRVGEVVFASPNTTRVAGVPPDRFEGVNGLLEMVHPNDRRRALRALARLRRQPGLTLELELGAWRPDGSEGFLEIRAASLPDSPLPGGTLISLRDITPRKTFETEIQHLAYYDALTGLANRRFLSEQGARALAMASRREQPVAVLYVDLDRFRQVNDVLGHDAGDALLGDVAESLRKSVRGSDIPARLGGDEFAVVLTEVRDVEAAARVAHRLLRALPGSAVSRGHEVPVGASIGIAMFPEDGKDIDALLKAAYLSMDRAKVEEVGVHFYRPELRAALSDRIRLEGEMRHALEQHEFQLHYQPIFDLGTGRMAGAEALSRWRHLTRGMVNASEFILLAEGAGLIRSLDRWAVARAIRQRRDLLADGWVGWVAVNLSPNSLADPGLPDYVRGVLEDAEMEPGALVLELPENAVLADVAAVSDLMWQLKDAGVAIAIDDFGATSLGHLRKLPVDILKLQPEFIAGIGRDDGDERLVEGAIAIAQTVQARVLAKGVERDDQVEWLRDAGCDFLQGYLTGAPVPAEDLQDDGGPTIIRGR